MWLDIRNILTYISPSDVAIFDPNVGWTIPYMPHIFGRFFSPVVDSCFGNRWMTAVFQSRYATLSLRVGPPKNTWKAKGEQWKKRAKLLVSIKNWIPSKLLNYHRFFHPFCDPLNQKWIPLIHQKLNGALPAIRYSSFGVHSVGPVGDFFWIVRFYRY